MSHAPIDELVVPFDSSGPAEKAERWRRLFRGRVITFVITIAVLVGIYVWSDIASTEAASLFTVY